MIPYVIVYRLLTKSDKQATQKRLELSTSAVTGRRSNQLSHWAIPEDNNLYLQNRTLKPNLYILTYILLSYPKPLVKPSTD